MHKTYSTLPTNATYRVEYCYFLDLLHNIFYLKKKEEKSIFVKTKSCDVPIRTKPEKFVGLFVRLQWMVWNSSQAPLLSMAKDRVALRDAGGALIKGIPSAPLMRPSVPTYLSSSYSSTSCSS